MLAAPLEVLFERAEVSERASRFPPFCRRHPAVMFVRHLARCQRGGASLHCRALGQGHLTACRAPQFSSAPARSQL